MIAALLPFAVAFLAIAAMTVRALWRRRQRRLAAEWSQLIDDYRRQYEPAVMPPRTRVELIEAKVVVPNILEMPKREREPETGGAA